ncbi:MAG: segregation/condensation protein A, partial [Schwartzia sp.]|nr:segregation/condensation protein A [Schwartzia sp. (in: firmicutes)]
MELLLHLIQVNKIDIYDIPIAALTEQYMAYLAEMRRFDIEVASEFLVMAATLLLI